MVEIIWSIPDDNVTDDGFVWYAILNDLSIYIFQGSFFIFEKEKLNLGSTIRNNKKAIEKTRTKSNNLSFLK